MTLIEIANKIDSLVLNADTRALFLEHINRFCQMAEAYGEALQPYSDALEKAKRKIDKLPPEQSQKLNGVFLYDYCPPPKDWIKQEDNTTFYNIPSMLAYRPKEPANPVLWLGLHYAPEREPGDTEKLMIAYVLMAIIHDYELRFSGIPTDTPIFSKQYDGKWFRRDAFSQDVWTTFRTPQKQAHLERALSRVIAHIDSGENPNRQPLGETVRLIYDKLKSLREGEAMTAPEICGWLASQHGKYLSESMLYREYKEQLTPWGLQHTKRIGFWIK